MIITSKDNPNVHLTVKERKTVSFPCKHLHQKGLLRGKILDFGCGLGLDVAFLREKGYDITAYDPHYFADYPQEKYDTILCTYVLNVLLPEEQAGVLMAVSELLKPTGKAYFTVRRDIAKNGFRVHYKHKVKVYQCNVILPYTSILKATHCEMYAYQHYNHACLAKHETSDCVFCKLEKERVLLSETATTYAIFDKYPVNEGHVLVIAKRHVSNYFDLSFKEQQACWLMVNRVKLLLEQRFEIDGFNIGVNVNKAAGQTVNHVHIHVIPRYLGDSARVVGGVPNVVEGKGDYL